MDNAEILKWIGLAAACILPFWNIPLIARILKRRSSRDLSLVWVTGVEACILAMLPSALISPDRIFCVFAVLNAVFFSCVTAVVWWFRHE